MCDQIMIYSIIICYCFVKVIGIYKTKFTQT